jgi:hypothetical protein
VLTRQPDLEVKLYDALRESFGSADREGIHLTDLLTPRKKFWAHVEPLPPTDGELGFFTAGRAHEDALQRFLGKHFVLSLPYRVEGIDMRPDFQAITNDIIPATQYAEFKTRRSDLPKDDHEANEKLSNYREQIRGYMTLLGRDEMYLIVLSLVEGKNPYDKFSKSKPIFAVYKETMTFEEREEMLARLFHNHRFLQAALMTESKDIAGILPLCPAWQCGKHVATLPVTCSCGKEYKTQSFADKHADETGHWIDFKWQYVPACKWYGSCKPHLIDKTRKAHD